jgi:iron complex outermembrane receptor protein
VSAFNAASIKTHGFDIEASYRAALAGIGLPGTFTLRALATHVIDFVTDSAVPGTIPVNTAGVNGVIVPGTTPSWKGMFAQTWDFDKYSLTLTERWISAGVYSNEWIECQTNCPVSTDQHPTVNDNHVPGAVYLDIGGIYRINEHALAYFKIDNALNKDPAPAPQTDVGYGANPYLYDVLGRMYRIGARVSF